MTLLGIYGKDPTGKQRQVSVDATGAVKFVGVGGGGSGAPRVTSIASSATPAVNTDNYDAVTITALAVDITSMTTNLTGTPSDFQKLIIRIKDNGTIRAITWGASFASSQATLPTSTTVSKVSTIGLIWDAVKTKWVCIATDQEP